MYEHFRNSLLLEFQNHFDTNTTELILSILDKAAADYTISKRETALVVVDDAIIQIVNVYLASKKLEGVSDLTIKNYSGHLRTFFNYVCKHPKDISTNDIRLYLATYQQQRKVSDRTLDKVRQILNCFFVWCLNEEYTTSNPCKNIKEIKYEVEPRHALTRFQLERLRRACKSKKELAIVDVLYSTGCRVAELASMRISDIDTVHNSIEIVGKGRKHNTVYFNTSAQISLNEYFKQRNDDNDYMFITDRKPHRQLSIRMIQKIFTQLSEQLGFKVSPHILRHTSATLALQSGMPLTQVQMMLGHASAVTTQIYAETSSEDVAVSHKKYVV